MDEPVLFSVALEELRDEFPEHRACLVLDDKTVRRYVVAWNPSLVRVRSGGYIYGRTMPDLWECVHVDLQALMDITGDSEPEVRAMLRRLQALQLIYPDGTVPLAAKNVVLSRLADIKSIRCLD